MKKILILLSALLLIISTLGCSSTEKEDNGVAVVRQGVTEEITLKTLDNFNIKGSYYEANSDKSVILLHQLNNDRNSWNDFALELKEAGYNVLTIDLRGHGESTGDWNNFNAQDFQNMVLDIKEADNLLRQKHPNTKLGIVGASIGANLAVNYGISNDVDVLILLSPGINYRGVETKTKVEDFQKPMLIVTSIGDSYSYDSSTELESVRKNFNLMTDTEFYAGGLHGTAMLGNRVNELIINWLNNNL